MFRFASIGTGFSLQPYEILGIKKTLTIPVRVFRGDGPGILT
jgi:hypothetical protein